MKNQQKSKTIYNVVIVDNQDFWQMPTDYLCTATSLKQAKKLLKQWLGFNYSVEQLDDDLNYSIEIWKCQTNTLADPKHISVDLKQLMDDCQA